MNVGLPAEMDESIVALGEVITELEGRLKEYFHDRDFGAEVQNLFICLVLTNRDSDALHPVRKLTYKKRVKVQLLNTVLENVVDYDIKPAFELFSQLSPEQAHRYLSELIVDSVAVLEQNRSKFPAFRIPEFRKALQECLTPSRERSTP